MIYRHNNIFKEKHHTLAKYIHDLSVCVTLDDGVTVPNPSLVARVLSAVVTGSRFELTITVYLYGSTGGPILTSKRISFDNLTPGTLYSKSEDGVNILFSTPISGEYSTYQPTDLYPYVVTINSPQNTEVSTVILSLPANDIDVTVLDGEIRLSLKEARPADQEASNGFLFVNGISPGVSGNINIKSRSSNITVSVSKMDEVESDVE